MKRLLAALLFAASLAHATYDPTFGVGPQSVILEDEFCGSTTQGTTTSATVGNLNWVFSQVGTTGVQTAYSFGDANYVCYQLLRTGAVDGNAMFLFLGNGTTGTPYFGALSAVTFDFETTFVIGSTTLASFFIGFQNLWTDGLWLRYDTVQADTTFKFIACKASVCTTVDSGVAANTLFHRLRMRSVTPGTVLMSLDGGAESSFTTNVPIVTLQPSYSVYTRSAAVRDFYVDWFYFRRDGLVR